MSWESPEITNENDNKSDKSIGYHSTNGSVHVTDEMEAIFISSLYYSLGASLEGSSRLIFDELVKKLSGLIKFDDTPLKRAGFSK